MKRLHKPLMAAMLASVLTVSQLFTGAALSYAEAAETVGVKDIVILQNVPQAVIEVEEDQINLKALNIYHEGHFTSIQEGLEWHSSNKNVAQVDEEGTVTFTGRPGRTFVSVTDGTFTDRIALDYKPARDGRNTSGQPERVPTVVKQQGEKYDIIGHAIDNMTIEEKIGQMLMPDFRNWNGSNVTEMLPEIEQLVKDYHLGGVILFRENVVTTEQTAKLVSQYQDAAEKFGLLLTIDQEGGIVTRLQSGTDMPGNMALGATRSAEISYDVGHAIGEELASLGINMNLAPVLDVNNNPDNPVIGVRSFSEDPELVGELGVAYTNGLQDTGVAATAKHFPGHGDTDVDSHLGLPEVPHDKERLLEVELYPFQQAMDAGIDAIMTAHVTFPQIDGTKAISRKTGQEIALPATLSYTVLTELMRDEMEYEGVIITDAMNMQAISDHFGPVDAAIRTVQAGSDIVLMPVGLQAVAEGLYNAVDEGEITEERVEASVERILTLKVERGIFKEENPQPLDEKIANAVQVVGSEEHKQVEREASERSITLVKNDNVLPLEAGEDENIVVVAGSYYADFVRAIREYQPDAAAINASSTGAISSAQWDQIRNADKVIVGTTTATVAARSASNAQMVMVQNIVKETEAPVIAVGIRNPYDIMAYPNVDAYIAQYGFRPASFAATAATIFGENAPTGQLPITIPDFNGNVLYEFGHGLTY